MTKKDRLAGIVNGYEDDELVQAAWEEFADISGSWDWDLVEDLRADIEEAETELDEKVVLSKRGRGRLRNFLLTKRLRD